ncbi:DUF3991 domain-containing protein [Pseudomonas aeruginosa]|nr:DUF3991 domain-containing protein [Pseudomonas aeruginosa]
MARFDKQADKDLIANLKIAVDLPKYAADLGMKLDKEASYKDHLVYRYGGGKFDTYRAPDGTWRWQERHSGKNGDIFKLHMEVKGSSFAEAKQAVAAFHGIGVTVSKEQLAESTQRTMTELKSDALDRQAKIEAGTEKAQRSFGLMSRGNASYLESRGISPEVLAATRWKTNVYGSACFPHYDADRNFSGYEYRGFDYQDKTTGEDRQAKGFSSDTEKGIYIANRDCANPTEIRFSEGGVDTLSTYQLATQKSVSGSCSSAPLANLVRKQRRQSSPSPNATTFAVSRWPTTATRAAKTSRRSVPPAWPSAFPMPRSRTCASASGCRSAKTLTSSCSACRA